MRSRSLRAVLVGLALFTLVSGCKKDGGPGAANPGANPNIRIAFVSNNTHPFWTFAQKGVEAAGKKEGVTVEFKMPPNGKAEEQRQIIDDLLVRGFNGIAISANDAANMADYLGKINKQIPVMTVDNDIPDTKSRRGYIGTHNYRAGRAAGELLAKAVPEGGKFVIFVGTMDAMNPIERRQGVLDYLAGKDQKDLTEKTPADAKNVKFGKFTLVDTKTDETSTPVCQQNCEDMLTKDKDIVAVVGLWAYNPPALLRAVDKLKSKAVVVGFDEEDDTLVGIKEGKIVGTVVQAPYQFGTESVKVLSGLARGNEGALKNYPGIEAENRIYIPHRVITKDNVDAFRADVKAILAK